MRIRAEIAREGRGHAVEPHLPRSGAPTAVGTPSSDPARHALAAVRTAQRVLSRVDAAVGALANRAHDPEHREGDDGDFGATIELPPLVITAEVPRERKPAATGTPPQPQPAAPSSPPAAPPPPQPLPGDEAAVDAKAGDTAAGRDARLGDLAGRLGELRAVIADGHEFRAPETWLLTEAIAELLGIVVEEGRAEDEPGREIESDAATSVDRGTRDGKQPDPGLAGKGREGGAAAQSKPETPDKRAADTETKEMERRNAANKKALQKSPIKAGKKPPPKLELPDLGPDRAKPLPKDKPAKPDSAAQIQKARGGGESTGGAKVAAWKAKIDAKTGAIQAKEVASNPDADRDVYSIQRAGSRQEPQSKQKKKELLAAAQEAVKPQDNYKPDDFNLPNDPLPDARRKVDEWIDRRIKQQDPPKLVQSPRKSWPQLGQLLSGPDEFGKTHVYQKLQAGRYGEIHVLAPGEKPPPLGMFDEVRKTKPAEDGKGSLGDRVKAHNAKQPGKVKAPVHQRSLGGEGHENEDLPLQAQEVPTIEGIAKVDPAKVLEAALAGAGDHADKILNKSRTTFPGGSALDPGYLNDWSPEIKRDVLAEIEKIRSNGNIAAEGLKEKLSGERDKVEQEVRNAEQVVTDKTNEARAEYKSVFHAVGNEIASIRDDLDRQAEDQAAMAKGGYDSDQVKWLKTTRDDYIKANDDKVTSWVDRYLKQRSSRKTKLAMFEAEQIQAYKACAELDRRTIKAEAPPGWEKDEAKKKEIDAKIQEIDDWETKVLEFPASKTTPGVKAAFKKMREDVDAEVDAWDANLKKHGEAYEKAVQQWYRDRLGIEKSLWQKILEAVLEILGFTKKQTKEWKRRSDDDNTTYLSNGQNDLAKLRVEYGEELDKKKLESIKGLSESQQAIADSYYGTAPKDSAKALAAGLMAEIGQQWRPRLHQRIEAKVLAGDPATIVAVANAMPGTRVQMVVGKLEESFNGPGTKNKEQLIYANLAGLSRIEMRAVEIVYEQRNGAPLRADMKGELFDLGEMLVGTKHDWERGAALLDNARSVAETSSVNPAVMDSLAVALNATMQATFLGTGAGTDEKELLKLLRGKTPAEIEAIKRAYKARYGRDLVAHIKSELLDGVSAPYQWEEALALLENRPDDAEAAALRASMGHVRVGGPKQYVIAGGIVGVLVTPFLEETGVLPDDDALINKATREPKDAEEALERIRQQAADDAKRFNWDDRTYRMALAQRMGKVDEIFGTKYGGGVGALDPKKSALETAFGHAFNNDTQKLLTGILKQDLAMESAGRTGAEIMPVPGRSEGVHKALFDQYKRQYEAERRDVEVELRKKQEDERVACTVLERDKDGNVVKDEFGRDKVDEEATKAKLRDWRKRWIDPVGRDERREEADELAEKRAKKKAPANMAKLTAFYEDPANGFTTALWSKGSFEADVFAATNVSWAGVKQLAGYEDRTEANDKTLMLLAQGGYLSTGQQLFYGVYGVGSDDEAVNAAYEGKSKKQIDKAHKELGEHMKLAGVKTTMTPEEWVRDDFSGRTLDDIEEKQFGVPRTNEEKIARAERQLAREQRSKGETTWGDRVVGGAIGFALGGPIGLIAGAVFGGGGVTKFREGLASREMQNFEDEVKALKDAAAAVDAKKVELAAKGIIEGDAEYYEALQPLQDRVNLMSRSVDTALAVHRSKIDSIADWVTAGIQAVMIVGAVVIGAVVSAVLEVGTAGGATPAVAAAWTAAIAALTTAAATITAKIVIKGGAYGWEELAGDVVMAVVEALLAAATANISTALTRTGTALGKFAAKGAVAKHVAEGIAGLIEGVVQSIPSAFLAAAINENFTAEAILGHIAQSAGMVAGMHLAKPLLNPVLGRLGNAITKRIGPRPTAEILSYRGSQKQMDDTFEQYQKEKPRATRQDFLRELDEAMLARHKTAFADPQTQQALRRDLLDGLPDAQRGRFAKAQVEVVSDAEFSRKFGSGDDVHVATRSGEPVVVVRAGTDLSTVGARSPHAFEGLPDPRAPRPRVAAPEVTAPRPRAAEPEAGPPRPRAAEPEAGPPRPRTGEPDTTAPRPRAGEPETTPPRPRAGEPETTPPRPRAGEPETTAPRPRAGETEVELPGGKVQKPPPEHVVMEPYSGPSLESAHEIAARRPGTKVIATESGYKPPREDVARFEEAGHKFYGDNQPASVPHGSVDEIKVRFPLSEVEAARVTFTDHLARVRQEFPDLHPLKQMELALQRVETVTNHGPYALERLKPGGALEVVYFEKEIGGEIKRLENLTYTDARTGKTYRFEVVSTEMVPKSQIAPHSGWNVPLKTPHDPVHVARLRKVEVQLPAAEGAEPHVTRRPGGPDTPTRLPIEDGGDVRGPRRTGAAEVETEMAEDRKALRTGKERTAAEPARAEADAAAPRRATAGPEAEAPAARPARPAPETEAPSAARQRIRESEAPLGTRAEAAAQAEKGRCAAWIWVEVMRNIGWIGAVADQPGWHPSVDAKPAKGQPRRGFGDIVRAISDPATGNKLPRIEGHPSELLASAQGMKPGTQIIISAKTKNNVWHAMLGVVQPDGSLELTHVGRASEVRRGAAITPDPAGNVMVKTRIYDAQVPELGDFHSHRWWVLPDMTGMGPRRVQVEPPPSKLLAEGERLPPRVRKAIEADLADTGHPASALRNLDDNALLAAHAKAQVELAPRRIAEFRETLPWRAKGELDALTSDTHLHHKAVTPETQARLAAALGTPIEINASLRPGEVQVKYRVGALGNIIDLQIHLGPGATLGDALLHVGTLHSFKRYQGVTGALRNLGDAVGRLLGSGKVPIGSRAHEAMKEIQKLPAIVESRRARLADRALDLRTRVQLEIEIEHLERQLARHVQALGDVAIGGRGHVSSEGRGKQSLRSRIEDAKAESKAARKSEGAPGRGGDDIERDWSRPRELKDLVADAQQLVKTAGLDPEMKAQLDGLRLRLEQLAANEELSSFQIGRRKAQLQKELEAFFQKVEQGDLTWIRGSELATPELRSWVEQQTTRTGKPLALETVGPRHERWLDWQESRTNAEMSPGSSTVLHRENVRKIELLEEVLHHVQDKIPKFDERFPYPQYELHVKDFMIRHRELFGLSGDDVRALQVMMKEQMRSGTDLRGNPLVLPESANIPVGSEPGVARARFLERSSDDLLRIMQDEIDAAPSGGGR